jgi:hypothetical protein
VQARPARFRHRQSVRHRAREWVLQVRASQHRINGHVSSRFRVTVMMLKNRKTIDVVSQCDSSDLISRNLMVREGDDLNVNVS